MNVEFLIHGVMSSGQTWWKQTDTDYYKQFYSGQAENNLMIVEVINRPHGISAYYNYLRNNNIQATREGAYFGMTVRIDGAYCLDVRTMYRMLDNLFNKMVVGTILKPTTDGRFEYAVPSFEAAKDKLERIEKQFSAMFTANLTQSDLTAISAAQVSKGTRININPLEADSQTVKNVIMQNAKIYTSPAFPSKESQKSIEAAKAQAAATASDAKNQINAANEETNRQRAANNTLQQQIRQLTSERDTAKGEIQQLQQKIKQQGSDRQLKEEMAKIQQPITRLASMMSARFPGAAHGVMSSDGHGASHRHEHRPSTLMQLLPWAVNAFLVLLLVIVMWPEQPQQPKQPEPAMPDTVKVEAVQNQERQNETVEQQTTLGESHEMGANGTNAPHEPQAAYSSTPGSAE